MLWTRDLKGLEDPWHPLALCWKPLPNIEKRHSNSLLDLEWSFLTQFRLEGISKLFRVSNRYKLENTSSSPQIPTYDQGSMDRSDLVHGSLDITEIAGLQTFLKQPTVFYYSTFSSSKMRTKLFRGNSIDGSIIWTRNREQWKVSNFSVIASFGQIVTSLSAVVQYQTLHSQDMRAFVPF